MFGISGTELVLIAVFAFIIFGPDKIPEIARTAGKAFQTFKRFQEDTERVIKAEMLGGSSDVDLSPLGANDTAASAGGDSASPTTASALYADNDDEEEEEE